MENWKSVVGFEGIYEVSDLGRVRGVDRLDSGGRRWVGKVLKPHLNKGYPIVTICCNGKPRTRQVHTLVLTAFVGPKPQGKECAHSNGNRADARLDNLSWKTPVENCADWIVHGTDRRGSKHPLAKITEDTVRHIFDMRQSGRLIREIAAFVNLNQVHVGNILNGKRWKHLHVSI